MTYEYKLQDTNYNVLLNTLMRKAAAIIAPTGYFSDVIHDVATIMRDLGQAPTRPTAYVLPPKLTYAWVVSEHGTHLINRASEEFRVLLCTAQRTSSTTRTFRIDASWSPFGSARITITGGRTEDAN